MTQINVRVDGASYTDDVEPRTLLVHYLRETARQGRHRRRLRHQQLRRLHRAPRRRGREELHRARRPGRRQRGHHDRGHRRRNGTLHPMQKAFHEMHGLQCGFCTPGMIMASIDLVQRQPRPERGRGPRGHRGQPLPLHRLPEHRPGGAAGGRGDARQPAGSAARRRPWRRRHDRRRGPGRPTADGPGQGGRPGAAAARRTPG